MKFSPTSRRRNNDGVDVTFDTFPYTAGNTTIRVIFPAWSQNRLVELLQQRRRMGAAAR